MDIQTRDGASALGSRCSARRMSSCNGSDSQSPTKSNNVLTAGMTATSAHCDLLRRGRGRADGGSGRFLEPIGPFAYE
jgi:hypothetical protein